MYKEPTIGISFRVSPETKDALIAKSIELEFNSLSEYIKLVMERDLDENNNSRLSCYDLESIRDCVSEEFNKSQELDELEDDRLEVILDEMMDSFVPKAASTLLKEYSTANYSKEDLKDSIFEFLNQCIDNENLDLKRIIRKGLE